MNEISTPILIAGAGAAGLAAAAAVSRMGVPVTVIEKDPLAGGMMRRAFPDSARGIASCAAMTALKKSALSAFGREMLAEDAVSGFISECLNDPGIDLLTDCRIFGVKMKNGRIKRIDAASCEGKIEIVPEYVIDATGAAVIARAAGIRMLPGDTKDGTSAAPVIRLSLRGADLRRFLREGRGYRTLEDPVFSGIEAEASYFGEVKVTLYSAVRLSSDRTAAEEAALQRQFDRDCVHGLAIIREKIAGMSNAAVTRTSDGYLFPEGAHPVGCHVLEAEEVREGKNFPDWAVGRILPQGEDRVTSLPYGSFVTREVKNLLLCGNALSMSGEAARIVSGMPFAMATGQAAGCAAVLSRISGERVERLDPEMLQETLLQLGMAGPETI